MKHGSGPIVFGTCFYAKSAVFNLRPTWRHLLLLPDVVIPGELHPLVRLDARQAQELHALHAVTCGFCVVFAAHTHLLEAHDTGDMSRRGVSGEEKRFF